MSMLSPVLAQLAVPPSRKLLRDLAAERIAGYPQAFPWLNLKQAVDTPEQDFARLIPYFEARLQTFLDTLRNA